MTKHIITDDSMCPIRPEHIDIRNHFMDTIWQNSETEGSANWLVYFAQSRGSWTPFTRDDMNNFYNKHHDGKFIFNKLFPTYIQLITKPTDEGDYYACTLEFVGICYSVSPKT